MTAHRTPHTAHRTPHTAYRFLLFAFCFLLSLTAMAQHQCGAAAAKKCNEDPKLEVKGAETIVIQTNAYSTKSNDIFKESLPFAKGVKDYKYDENSYKIAVAYDAKKTTPEKIREEIAKLGFDADQVKANEKARAKLPEECKTMPKGCSKPCGKH
jgi:copper chaperone CopZ